MKNKEPKISIIIPVYNAENYIKRALNSCLEQTYTNFEIICVNDGSTDNTGSILQMYKESHKTKIVLINKENGGIAKAYESALNTATGDYIILLDNDDMLTSDALEKCVKTINSVDYDVDAICFKVLTIYKDDLSKNYVGGEIERYGKKDGSVFNLMIGPRQLIKKSCYDDVLFPYKLNRFQDPCRSFQVSCNIKSFIEIQDVLYYWIIREDSVSNATVDLKDLYHSYTLCFTTLKTFLKSKNIWEEYKYPYFTLMYRYLKKFFLNTRLTTLLKYNILLPIIINILDLELLEYFLNKFINKNTFSKFPKYS